MFEDDENAAVKRWAGLPLALEALSVGELEAYRGLLEQELQRVAQEKQRKQSLKAAADDFFKSA